MPGYSKVQFIAWEVYTGPVHDMRGFAIEYGGIKSQTGDRRWDIVSQCVDISARIEFTKAAIAKAHSKADPDEDTLKIFMAPEFVYRGGGAYVHDLINGWETSPFPNLPAPYSGEWGGLFGGLKDLVADDKFKDWIFVFGTAVSAFFQVRNGKALNEPEGGSLPATCINASLIQCGGALHRHDCYVSQKHLKSAIDFITLRETAYTVHKNDDVEPFTPASLALLEDNMTATEGGAVFAFRHIRHMDGRRVKFGIEVCLDHVCCDRNRMGGRLCNSQQRVDIQLVPSGGITLNETSVCLLPPDGDRFESYAFNCDGLITLSGREYGTHVQLWNQSADGTCTHLEDIDNGSDPEDSENVPIEPTVVSVPTVPPLPERYKQNQIRGDLLWASLVEIDCMHPNYDAVLFRQWPSGPGFVRVLAARPLSPTGPAVL